MIGCTRVRRRGRRKFFTLGSFQLFPVGIFQSEAEAARDSLRKRLLPGLRRILRIAVAQGRSGVRAGLRREKRAGAVIKRAFTCAGGGGAKPGSAAGGGASVMASRVRRRRTLRGSGGGGGGGRGGSRTCDFRVALERGVLSGWGGPEATLRGLAALSVPPGRPCPSLNQPRDRVGEVPPAPHSLASADCVELGAATCWPSDLGRGLP